VANQDAVRDRSALMAKHVEARRRRDEAPLDGEAFRAAAEEITRIEVAIAEMEEPPVEQTATAAGQASKP
jgi:hypothetical protein